MEIKQSEYCGYCYGVKRALSMVEETIKDNSDNNIKIFTLGSVIHNPGVMKELANNGLRSVKDLDDVTAGSIFIVKSHGISPKVIEGLKSKDLKIIDTTCPSVKKAQLKARELSDRRYFVVVIGNKAHPEVLGIKDQVKKGNYIVLENEKNAALLERKKKIGVIIQTTQTISKLKLITDKLQNKTRELLIYNTICNTTSKRQNASRELSAEVDMMIIVGGKDSANTTHLAEIASKSGTPTYHIENYSELQKKWFKNIKRVGISGGASTPENDITDVRRSIDKILF